MKKIILLLIAMLILTASCQPAPTPAPAISTTIPNTSTSVPTLTPGPAPSLSKDFNDPSEAWCEKQSYPFGDFYCQDGEFHLINKGTAGSIATYVTDDSFKNFRVQAQMKLIGESGSYGIAFSGQDNPPSFFIFQIRPSGQFRLTKMTFSGNHTPPEELIAWTDTTAIMKGEEMNLLEVLAQEKQITLFTNNEELTNVTDASFSEGSVGPVSLELGHAAVSSFNVWELP